MRYPLLATDLDGTLLNDQKQIDIETIEAIQEYRRKGGKVVVCSGRSPLSAAWIAQTIGIKGEPIIAYNGAIILDENGRIAEQSVFQFETLMQFWKLCEREGVYAHFYEGDTLLIPEENKWNKNWIENNIPPLDKSGGKIDICRNFRKRCKVNVVNNFYDYFKEKQPNISKIAVFHEGEPLQSFSRKIAEQVEDLEISSSLNYLNLEISPKETTKATALMKIIEKQGLSMKQAAAIGDNYNDSQMLSNAGMGIAMGNAPKAVKRIADRVTASNNEAGAALAIRDYLLS